MHGLGNDFVVIDKRFLEISEIDKIAHRLLNRHLGIGGDQLLLVDASSVGDFRMGIFNSDGSEVEMCGNGIRCFYRYLLDKGLTKKQSILVETPAGLIKPSLNDDMISVDMGEPILEGKDIPVDYSGEVIEFPLEVGGGTVLVNCVSMGNPHAVIFVEETKEAPVHTLGKIIEKHSFFPKRTNVEFVKVISPEEIEMRVWERGVGETMACGTGACAAAVAHIRKNKAGSKVKVHLLGGDLDIVWDKRVHMTGPAVSVFDGEIEL